MFAKLTVAAFLMLSVPGCLLGAAGVVEASNSPGDADPMGESEYEAPDGTIGWHGDVTERSSLSSFEKAARRLGCTTQLGVAPSASAPPAENVEPQEAQVPQPAPRAETTTLSATCPSLPKLSAVVSSNHKQIYRLCAAGTERMACRSAWEKVNSAIGPSKTASR